MIMPAKKRLQLGLSVFLPLLHSVSLATDFNITEFQPGIFVHQGQHVSFEHENRDDIANIGFIEGDDCIAVIDTGGSIDIGKKLKHAIETISKKPVCYVINTHVHFDHVLGNYAFVNNDTKFVGHKMLKDAMVASTEFFLDEYANELGSSKQTEDTKNLIVLPDVLVEDTLEIDLGNRKLTLTAHKIAHSRNDLSILDQQTGTLWLSDLLFVDRIPAIEGKLKGWLSVLDEIKALEPNHVIPGHGNLALSVDKAMALQHAYLMEVLTETRSMIQDGAFMEDVIDKVGQETKTQWILHEQHHKRNISNAFVELEWE